MSDMKCPFCQQKLEERFDLDGKLFSYVCENENCSSYDFELPPKVWQELIRTRKALEIAVDALKEIIDWDKCVALQSNDFVGIANTALEQITIPEQKEEK